MIINPNEIIMRRPDDWHSHVRDDAILNVVLPFTSLVNGRAIIMPNLNPPINSIMSAVNYRKRIISLIPPNHLFTPLMTCYLTNSILPNEIASGFYNGLFTAVKFYPANVTTNSQNGIVDVKSVTSIFEKMQDIGMPLLIHGEINDNTIDIFDRELYFIDLVLNFIRKNFPKLKIVFEHITTKEAVDYIIEADNCLAATITPQHLMLNRNDLLKNGIHPHLYCLPILKRSIHQKALRNVIASGHSRFFIGTDTAPHLSHHKESHCGCAGIFSSPTALSAYVSIFEEINALNHLETFCSENGPNFYGLPLNSHNITLIRKPWKVPNYFKVGRYKLIPFLAGKILNWQIKTDLKS